MYKYCHLLQVLFFLFPLNRRLNWGIADICSHAVYATATPDMPTQPPTGPASRDPRKHYTGGDSFGRCSSIPELVAALTRGKG